jgi:hypothetical protein
MFQVRLHDQSEQDNDKARVTTLDTCSRSDEQVGKPRKGPGKNMMYAGFWKGVTKLYILGRIDHYWISELTFAILVVFHYYCTQ